MEKYLGMCILSEGFQGLVGVFVWAVCISVGNVTIRLIQWRMRLSFWSSTADCDSVEFSSAWRRKIIQTFFISLWQTLDIRVDFEHGCCEDMCGVGSGCSSDWMSSCGRLLRGLWRFLITGVVTSLPECLSVQRLNTPCFIFYWLH